MKLKYLFIPTKSYEWVTNNNGYYYEDEWGKWENEYLLFEVNNKLVKVKTREVLARRYAGTLKKYRAKNKEVRDLLGEIETLELQLAVLKDKVGSGCETKAESEE